MIILLAASFPHNPLFTQESPSSTLEQQFESLATTEESETEDDSYIQQLNEFRRYPIELNSTEDAALKELKMLSALQIEHFLLYRRLFGKLISIYELQAVPDWDLFMIRKILPYVKLGDVLSLKENLNNRIKNGDHNLLIRFSQVLEKAKGYQSSATSDGYAGGRGHIFFRYRYQYKNFLQYGLTGDKDAGEPFFKGKQKFGFDFYSFHFYARNQGRVHALALGDFTVNMGQGLIQWQSLGFKKNAEVISIKRESPVLRPYNSGGEITFHRGAGISIKNGKLISTVFASVRKVSAAIFIDSLKNETFISSFLTSGYHRTANELLTRNNHTQMSTGAAIVYKEKRWHLAINGIYFKFSLPVLKADAPYNLYSIKGSDWFNLSTDYSYTWRNLHLFGETAVDKFFNTAFLNGLLISVDGKVDLSFLQRKISPAYQAIGGNSFTENSFPTNETGWYAGISLRPASGWKLVAYADLFKFPWLKYLVDAPGSGKEFLLQLTYTPSRQLEIYSRYRTVTKLINRYSGSALNDGIQIPQQNWRTQILFKLGKEVTIRNRFEYSCYNKKGDNEENGFLIFLDGFYRPLLKHFSGNLRLQYFEIDDFDSRIYGYENDVLYSFSIPSFVGKGFRYYMNLSYAFRKKISIGVKWSQTFYPGKKSINKELEEINGNQKTEVRLQVIWNMNR